MNMQDIIKLLWTVPLGICISIFVLVMWAFATVIPLIIAIFIFGLTMHIFHLIF